MSKITRQGFENACWIARLAELIYMKQQALSSSSKWLLNYKGHKWLNHKTGTNHKTTTHHEATIYTETNNRNIALERAVSLAIRWRGLNTVNSEIFARISISRMALKDIFATLKIHDKGKIYTYQSTTEWSRHFTRVLLSRNLACICESKFRENKSLAKISEFTVVFYWPIFRPKFY